MTLHGDKIDTNDVVSVKDELLSIGEVLRSSRLRAGVELEDVSKTLRIQLAHLIAMEEGRVDDLPGKVYALGFLNTYSDYLGLDKDELVKKYKTALKNYNLPNNLDFPIPSRENRNPKPWLILCVLLLAGLAYVGWYYFSASDQRGNRLASELSESLVDSDVYVSEETLSSSELKDSETKTEDKLDNIQSVNDQLEVSSLELDTADKNNNLEIIDDSEISKLDSGKEVIDIAEIENEKTSSEQSGFSEEILTPNSSSLWDITDENEAEGQIEESDILTGNIDAEELSSNVINTDSNNLEQNKLIPTSRQIKVYGESNEDVRIILKAKSDSWVQVQGPENELLITRILRTGDSYRVPNRIGLTMITGNAGALEITVDDIVVSPVGPTGAVRRNIALDPDKLLAGSNSTELDL